MYIDKVTIASYIATASNVVNSIDLSKMYNAIYEANRISENVALDQLNHHLNIFTLTLIKITKGK